jgi:hypothetical protein
VKITIGQHDLAEVLRWISKLASGDTVLELEAKHRKRLVFQETPRIRFFLESADTFYCLSDCDCFLEQMNHFGVKTIDGEKKEIWQWRGYPGLDPMCCSSAILRVVSWGNNEKSPRISRIEPESPQ